MDSGLQHLVVAAPGEPQAPVPQPGVVPLTLIVGRQAAARLGWSVCGLSIAAAGLGWLLFLASGSTADRGHGGDPIQDLAFPVFATVGALIVSRRAGNAVGWLCCAAGLLSSLGLNGLGYGYVHYALAGPGGGLPGGVWVAWLTEWINDLSFGLGPLIFLLFPTDRPPSAIWRPVAWFAAGMAGVAALLDAVRPGPLVNFPLVDNPVGLPNQLTLWLSNAVGLVEVLLFVVGAASVFVRFTTARGIERQQIKWFAYAASLIGVGVVPVIALPDLLGLGGQQFPAWARLLANQHRRFGPSEVLPSHRAGAMRVPPGNSSVADPALRRRPTSSRSASR